MSISVNLHTPKTTYVCARCGNCCKWRGYVHVTQEEIQSIAQFLGIEHKIFMDKYIRLTKERTGLSLIENPDGSCVFLENDRCLINPVKPRQCKAFPNEWNFEGFQEVCNARAKSE